MKKKLLIITLILSILILGGCGNKYQGYWCKYNEISTIVVLLEKNHTKADRQALESKFETFENVASVSYNSREDYANELGEDPNSIDIYDTYVIVLDSMDSIGTYIEEIEIMSGVNKAEQSYAKANFSLYNIKRFGKYTYTNSDEATEADLEEGKYKKKNGVITFTPKNKDGKTKLLYIKDNYLCGDADCSEIYAKSNSTCTAE